MVQGEVGKTRHFNAAVILVLISLLSVFGILMLLLGRVDGPLPPKWKARNTLSGIQWACEHFRRDHGRYPRSLGELAGLEEVNGVEIAPYIDPVAITDPWGREYIYSLGADGGNPSVRTLGSDGRVGGRGDAEDLLLEAGDL